MFLKVFILKMFLLWSIFYETLFFLKLYTPMEQAITKITLAMFRSLFLSKILKEIYIFVNLIFCFNYFNFFSLEMFLICPYFFTNFSLDFPENFVLITTCVTANNGKLWFLIDYDAWQLNSSGQNLLPVGILQKKIYKILIEILMDAHFFYQKM